jgi:hypothetical protein
MKKILILLFISICLNVNAINILTPFGYENIENINVGDFVIGQGGVWNRVEAKRTFNKAWFDEQELDEFKWYLVNGTYKIFRNQNIYTTNSAYTVCHGFELEIGNIIFDDNNNLIQITSLDEIEGDSIWWKLDISGDHSFIEDGILLHNASRFWVGGGSSANWSATGQTNWSATSGGSNNATVPGSSDDVTFNSSGNSSSTVSATITILSLTISSGYTSTITHNAVVTVAGNLTLNTGYTIAGSSAMTISAASTITGNSKAWANNMTFSGANTKTISGNFTITGTLILTGTTTLNQTGTDTIIIGGLTSNSAGTSGTARIKITGGTWSGASTVSNNMDIAGNVTISGLVYYNTNTLTYISGTVTTTSSTLNLQGNLTLNTNGITWFNITVGTSATITLNSLLTATGTLSLPSASVTMAGSFGFTVGLLLYSNTSAATFTLVNTVTYTITTDLTARTSRTGSILLITSDHATNKAILTLNQGASCNLLANLTRIDASGGRTIRTFNGTITSCTNVQEFHDLQTIGF